VIQFVRVVIILKENIILDKSKLFAIRIVKLYKYLQEKKIEYVMSKQLLRSGTSIGANLCEADYAVSHKEFIVKLQISLKEAAESKYWLELLFNTGYITEAEYVSILSDCEEIIKMLVSSLKTAKTNAAQ
jgi:four helix bundle protein